MWIPAAALAEIGIERVPDLLGDNLVPPWGEVPSPVAGELRRGVALGGGQCGLQVNHGNVNGVVIVRIQHTGVWLRINLTPVNMR